MYIYKNKITGVEVSTHGKVNGANWEFVREDVTEEDAPTEKPKAKAKGKEKEPDGE